MHGATQRQQVKGDKHVADERLYRVTLGTALILLLLIRGYYSRRAGEPSLSIPTGREGKLSTMLLRFFSGLTLISSLVYAIVPDWMSWGALPMAAWLRWVGAGLAIVTVPLFVWVHHELGKNWSLSVVIKEEHALVTTGPYRWVRHPMYTTFSVWGLAFFLLSANWIIGTAFLGMCVAAAARAGKEEAILTEEFGDQYHAYMRRTGRFLPPLRLVGVSDRES